MKRESISTAILWAGTRALIAEMVLAVLVAIFGFGGSVMDTRWYELVLPTTQAPGIALLATLGLCCGFRNGLVISDVIVGRWGGLTTAGMPILFVANTLMFAAILLVGRILWRGLNRRRLEGDAPAA